MWNTITGEFPGSRKARHPGGGQRATVYSSASLCLLHKVQNHRPVSTLELSIADRVFDKSKPSTVWSGVIPPKEPGTYLVFDGNFLGPHTVFCPEKKKNDIHGPRLPNCASFQSKLSKEEGITERQRRASSPVSLSYDGHSPQPVYSGRVCLLRHQEARCSFSAMLCCYQSWPQCTAGKGKAFPEELKSPTGTDKLCSGPALGNEPAESALDLATGRLRYPT